MSSTILLVSDATRLGGAERYLATLVATGLGLGGVDFVAGIPPSGEALRSPLEEAGAEVVVVKGLRRRPGPGAVRSLLALAAAHHADGVLANLTDQGDNGSALVASGLGRRRFRSAAVLHLWVPGRPKLRMPVYSAFLRLPSTIITPGQGTADDIGRIGIGANLVPNGLSRAQPLTRAAARSALDLPDDALVIGGIGRLSAQKGWDVLAKAWPQIQRRRPQLRAAVIGDGEDREHLLSSNNGISFLGERKEAARLLPAFDLLVVPSIFEAHALVPMEAAMAGIPTVASDIAGVRESTGPATLLVPSNDPVALAQAVIAMSGDLERWTTMAAKHSQAQQARFDPTAMARSTLELLLGA